MTSALTPPKGSELKEKVIALLCIRFNAHVDVGTQLKTDVVLDVTVIWYSAASSKSGAPTTTESKVTPRLDPNAASDCELWG